MRVRWYAGTCIAFVAVAVAVAVVAAYAVRSEGRRAPTRPVAADASLDPAEARHYGPVVPDAAQRAPLAPGETRYQKVGARLLPPKATDHAAIAASDALAVFRESGLRPDVFSDGGTPTIDLVRYTNDEVGPVDPKTGAVTPTAMDRLAWVVTFPTAAVVVYGGRGHASVDGGRCPFVYVVDAASGAPIDSFQECAPLHS
jgi:hypothetical protein